MISYLKGKILEKSLNYLILFVGAGSASGGESLGIGYKVFVTPEVLEKAIGAEVALYIYHKVSDDGQSLFGLPNFSTLQFFELLITVSGVGPKVALSILSSAKVSDVQNAIASQDAGMFRRISGIGTKTAEKIIVELKSKMGTVTGSGLQVTSSEVFDALLALGYKQNEVREVVGKLDSSLSTERQLKQALQFLGKN
jgi:Holliday junction DNA helicase RuvA